MYIYFLPKDPNRRYAPVPHTQLLYVNLAQFTFCQQHDMRRFLYLQDLELLILADVSFIFLNNKKKNF